MSICYNQQILHFLCLLTALQMEIKIWRNALLARNLTTLRAVVQAEEVKASVTQTPGNSGLSMTLSILFKNIYLSLIVSR